MFPYLSKPRDPIKAEDRNSILRYLARMLRVRVAGGDARWDENGGLQLLIRHPQIARYMHPARILEVTGSNPDFAANVRYTVGATGKFSRNLPPLLPGYQGMYLEDVKPSYGRPVGEEDEAITKIRPAKVGAFCFILTDQDEESDTVGQLMLIPGGTKSESLYFRECSAPAP